MALGHTGVQRGKRVLVILKSGERLIDHFKYRNDLAVFLREAGRVEKERMRSLSIYKGPVAGE
jgi:hypothetical protein